MKSVKLFLCISLLAMDITCSADDLSGLVRGRESVSSRDSEPICITQPTVNYCISVYDGKPVIRALSQVISSLSTPLTFSLSFKDGVAPKMMNEVPPVIMDASCLDHNCTALFLVEPVYKSFYNLSVNVTVRAENCSNSTVKMSSEFIRTNEIVNTALVEVMETRATTVCKLSCFSKDIGCIPQQLWLLRKGKRVKKLTSFTFHISNITGDSYSYSYPSQNITVTNLASGKSYLICIRAYNLTTTELYGSELCEEFTTIYHHKEGISGALIVVIVPVSMPIVALIIVYIIYYHCYKENQIQHGQTAASQPVRAGANPTGFFVQPMTRRETDEPEVNIGLDKEQQITLEIEDEAPSDDISLPSAEHTNSV